MNTDDNYQQSDSQQMRQALAAVVSGDSLYCNEKLSFPNIVMLDEGVNPKV